MESFSVDLGCTGLRRTFVFSVFGESRRFELLKENRESLLQSSFKGSRMAYS